MKAIVFEAAGGPAQVLTYMDMPTPQAEGQNVLVKVAARPIHPADMAFIRGLYRVKPAFPQVAGLEGAGSLTLDRDLVARTGVRPGM